ncbi:hypothetical protein BV20DRAFT_968393 [Pilatotrama ljubarskyi]|nr:hypothetical protein BV20DRAFT_968393 [Pilatotrama ljubarskyi]
MERLSRERTDARAGHGRPMPDTPAGQPTSGVDESMEVEEDVNRFLTLNDDQNAIAGPSSANPQTPQRAQPAQSYPTPPTTISPPSRQVSYASEASSSHNAEEALTFATLEPIREEPVSGPSQPSGQGDPGRSEQDKDAGATDNPFSRILQAAQVAKRQRLQLQRELEDARAIIAAGAERDARNLQQIPELEEEIAVQQCLCAQAEKDAVAAREQELSEAHRRHEELTGERDLYQRQHFVTAVALTGSRREIERLEGVVGRLEVEAARREQEGTDLVARIRAAVGHSPWGS